MILMGTPRSEPAASAFWLDRMPMARGLHNMAERTGAMLDGRHWEVAASTCVAAAAAWGGIDAGRRAIEDIASGNAVAVEPAQAAWINYELELMSAWMASAQAGVNIQVTPATLRNAVAEATVAPPVLAFPTYPTTIRTDGSKPRTLPNGLPVDAAYVEFMEEKQKVRLMLLAPVGDGLRPHAEGASFLIDLDDLDRSFGYALGASIDRKVAEMSASKMLRFDRDGLRAHMRAVIPLMTAAMPIVSWALRSAHDRDHEPDRLAPAAVRALDSSGRSSADWADIIYL